MDYFRAHCAEQGKLLIDQTINTLIERKTRGGLLINSVHLSVSAIGSARYPRKVANEQFARIERLVELKKATRPTLVLWAARIKNSIANERLHLQNR